VFPIALASGAGTFLAAFAALVSAYMIVFDEAPPVIWNVGIGFWWMVEARRWHRRAPWTIHRRP